MQGVTDVRREAALFRGQGFVVLTDVLGSAELQRLRDETAVQIAAGPDREPQNDYVVAATPSGERRFFRIQFLTSKSLVNDSMLLAIAHPRILALVAELLGPDWCPYGSAMVFKGPEGGPEVALHRDSQPQRGFHPDHLFFSADVYLDPVGPDGGCVEVLPGSHRIDDATGDVALGLSHPDLVPVPMAAGDVLFHDAMLLHGSRATPPGTLLRRVLYYSYQSADW